MHRCWNLCHFCWSLFVSVVFWCYKAYKNGKYFIYSEGKIFGVHIKYVKIRREWPLNGSQLNNLVSRSTLKGEEHSDNEHALGGSLGLETSKSNFPYRSPGEENGNPLQYCCLENFMDRGAWWATVHGVTNSWTRLSD